MTTGSGPPEQTVSDVVAARIRESRLRRGWTAAQLAEACARRGADKLTTSVINNIETGRRDAQGRRRRELSIDELLVLALVLDVAPIQLMGLPTTGGEAVMRIAPTCSVSDPQALLLWIRGDKALPENDGRRYYSSVIEHLPPSDAAQSTAELARSVLEERAAELMERFNAETATLAANAAVRAQDRLRELVGAVEAGLARGATEDELRALLKEVRKD
jgi:transcriptional regulator with XRE-family HTH domain